MDHVRAKLGFSKPEPEPVKERVDTPKKYESKTPKNEDNKRGEDGDSIELHVSNISLKATEDDLRKLFEDYGEIMRIKLLKRGTMQKAFLDMDTDKNAKEAID